VLAGVQFTGAAKTPSSGHDGTPEWVDLDELERLAETAGAQVVGRLEQRRLSPDVRSLLGRGKVEQLKTLVKSAHADLVIFDNNLSPAQGRNLERMLGIRVLDRTELILDIFARHAHTRQSRLQVSLAQHEYLLPRLARMWKHLERQAGGIGTRGPGETQIETDRRLIRRRISRLHRELREIDRRVETQHKQRLDEFRVALVGYTNAGKSSLMNCLSGAGVYVEDQLFATLDATTRKVELPGGRRFLLTDTVGFLRKLPHHLVESFRATLEEVVAADLLLHVVDSGAEEIEEQIEAVEQVLKIVCRENPEQILVFNKIDTLSDPEWVAHAKRRWPAALFTDALHGRGLTELLDRVELRLRSGERDVVLAVDTAESRSLALLHDLGQVLKVEYGRLATEVHLRIDPRNYGRMARLPGVEILQVIRHRRLELPSL
jgi:GTP-binding protein HflX